MKNIRKPIFLLAALLVLTLAGACLHAQMVSPAIDRPDQPFSYFSKPTDEIGMMDAEAATEITPEGYLRTGFGELMFFAGPELEPTSARIRTLEEGRLPIVHYQFERDGVVYRFTLFAATQSIQNGNLMAQPSNFIRVAMKNEGGEPNRAILATGIRYDAPNNTGAHHGDNRFDRPREGKFRGDYRQPGETFRPDWVYSFTDNGFLRDGRLLYTFPAGYVSRGFTLHGRLQLPAGREQAGKASCGPHRPRGHRHLLTAARARRRVRAGVQDAGSSHRRPGSQSPPWSKPASTRPGRRSLPSGSRSSPMACRSACRSKSPSIPSTPTWFTT